MKRSKFTESLIFAILKQAEAGVAAADICREYGVSAATFYKWKAKYSGMDTSMMKRLRELEEENLRLKFNLPFRKATTLSASWVFE